jgi:DNA-binding response OmpR family regulator
LAERKKITLKFQAEFESLMGYVDKDKLEKIVTNLLSNAFKFTPEGGTVKVNLSLRGDMAQAISTKPACSRQAIFENEIGTSRQVGTRNDGNSTRGILIKIFNSGAGIPSDQLDKIFDRFYQADESYTKDSEGTGIGLALTKELVEAHHGEICVESELNKGTTFTVRLPIEREYFKPEEIVEESLKDKKVLDIPFHPLDEVVDPSEGEAKITPLEGGARRAGDVSADIPTEEPATKLQTLKSAPLLLIVEDNPDVTSYISSFMEKDYRIITAENGKQGLKKALDKFPDLIISDVMMPVMDGFELCRRIKSDERISHIPVILLTAKADMDSKIEGLEFGADDYVTKPFEARELQIRSKNLIEQRKKLREKFSALIDLGPADIAATSMDEQLLQRLLAVFEEHIEEPEFSIEQLARQIGMSRRHLNRKIQAITNLSTTDFIRSLRLKRAAGMLQNASGTISEIAYRVGFNNLSYFSRAFRKQFGRLPSEFPQKQ